MKLHDTFAHGLQKVYKYLCKKQHRETRCGVETRFLMLLVWGKTQEPRPPKDHPYFLIHAWTPAFEGLKIHRPCPICPRQNLCTTKGKMSKICELIPEVLNSSS